jgi:hypothetical protein
MKDRRESGVQKALLLVKIFKIYYNKGFIRKRSKRKRECKTIWGGRIRTSDTRYQKPLPYHLATPQDRKQRV